MLRYYRVVVQLLYSSSLFTMQWLCSDYPNGFYAELTKWHLQGEFTEIFSAY